VHPARFAALVLYLPPVPPSPRLNEWLRDPRTRLGLALAALALIAAGLGAWLLRPDAPARPEETLYVIEDVPPTPEPPPPVSDPAPPAPPEEIPQEVPPPQFGLEAEALGEQGDMAVATGNTLMTEADTVVKAPVAALPSLPQLVDQPPKILKGRPPEYPALAHERNLEGLVVVIATLDTEGRVTGVEVEKSAGRYFDPDVVRAVKSLVFQPTIRDGRRVALRVRLPYEFRLD
jgi:protein TonB